VTKLASDRVSLGRPQLVVPAYFRPDVRPDDWIQLAKHAPQVRMVILNVANGPGTGPDPAFYPALDRLREAGVAVAGYVDSNYGRRPGRDALDDLGLFLRWYDVAGVLFDRVSVTAEHLDYYAALSRSARDMGAHKVLFNHGAHPLEAYAEHADLLGTFEGPWRAYLQLAVPRWTRSRPATNFYHVVYSVPPANYDHAYLLAMRRRAGCVYITDRKGANPYDCLPAGGLEPESRWMR
jgi:hypothetical protein